MWLRVAHEEQEVSLRVSVPHEPVFKDDLGAQLAINTQKADRPIEVLKRPHAAPLAGVIKIKRQPGTERYFLTRCASHCHVRVLTWDIKHSPAVPQLDIAPILFVYMTVGSHTEIRRRHQTHRL